MSFEQDLSNLLSEAKKMQDKMMDAQNALTQTEVKSKVPGIEAVMGGDYRLKSIKIDPAVLEDADMLADLITALINKLVENVEKVSQDKIKQLTAGFSLPTDLFGDESGTGGKSE